MMIRPFLLATTCALALSLPAFGQETNNSDPGPNPKSNSTRYGGLTVFWNDFSDINNALRRNGYAQLENNSLSFWGGRRFTTRKGWVTELAFEAGFTPDITSGAKRTSLREFGFMNRFTYDFLQKQHYTNLFPIVGGGIYWQSLSLYDGYSDDFDQLVNNKPNIIRLSEIPIRLELGLGFEQGFRLLDTDIFLGIRGGVVYEIFDGWSFDSQFQTDLAGPSSPWRPYVMLTYRDSNTFSWR